MVAEKIRVVGPSGVPANLPPHVASGLIASGAVRKVEPEQSAPKRSTRKPKSDD